MQQALSHFQGVQRGLRWLFPLPYMWISSAIYLSVLTTYSVYHLLYTARVFNTPLLIAVMVSLFVLERWEYYRYGESPGPGIAMLFMAYRLILVELVGLHLDIYYLSFLYTFLPFIAVMQMGWRAGVAMGIGIGGLYLTKLQLTYPWWTQNVIHIDALLTFFIMMIFTLVMAGVIQRERRSRFQMSLLLGELEMSNHRLRDYAVQVEKLATIQERTRLARDIHDTLGHYLTAMSIQLEKADVFFDRKPEAARLSLKQSKTIADEALREVRHSVGMLRTNSVFSLQEALQRMIDYSQSDTLHVYMDIEGNVDNLPDPLTMSLYRAVQEGLTNIQKHASASTAHIGVAVSTQAVTLTIRDNGCGFEAQKAPSCTSGQGLKGLRERLRLIGGSIDIVSNPGLQTELKVMIPMMGAR